MAAVTTDGSGAVMTVTRETAPTGPGFIDQCDELNKALAEAHAIAAQIISPRVVNEQNVKEREDNCFAGQLANNLSQAMRSAQGLVEHLREIAQRF